MCPASLEDTSAGFWPSKSSIGVDGKPGLTPPGDTLLQDVPEEWAIHGHILQHLAYLPHTPAALPEFLADILVDAAQANEPAEALELGVVFRCEKVEGSI